MVTLPRGLIVTASVTLKHLWKSIIPPSLVVKQKKRHSCLQHHITNLTFSVFPSLCQGSSSVRVSGWLIDGLHNKNWVNFNSWDLLYMHAEAFLKYFRLLKAFKCLISEYVCISLSTPTFVLN